MNCHKHVQALQNFCSAVHNVKQGLYSDDYYNGLASGLIYSTGPMKEDSSMDSQVRNL